MAEKFLFRWIVAIAFFSITYSNKSIIVHTDYGDVEGYETDIARIFYGIPYAEPPVDVLRLTLIFEPVISSLLDLFLSFRWKQPVPIGKWTPRVINATQAAPACPQPPCSLPSILCPKMVRISLNWSRFYCSYVDMLRCLKTVCI